MEDNNFIQVGEPKPEPESVLTTTPAPTVKPLIVAGPPAEDKMVYDIIDTEHPENNATVDPNALAQDTPEQIAARREAAYQRAAHMARILLAEKINKRREKENLRALKGRVNKRRKKNKLEKSSRKRNRS
jgi:hypothetical protein